MDIKDIRVCLNVDTKPLASKTIEKESYTIMRLKNAATQTEIRLYDLFLQLTNGYACTGGLLNGRKDENWLSQQAWFFDIDNKSRTLPKLTIAGALEVFNDVGIKPAFVYETYSSTPELRKFRIAAVSLEVVTCSDTRRRIMEGVTNLFPTAQEPNEAGRMCTVAQIDRACTDAARFFYGCTPHHYKKWFDSGEAFTL